jgi:hypothetical protein
MLDSLNKEEGTVDINEAVRETPKALIQLNERVPFGVEGQCWLL